MIVGRSAICVGLFGAFLTVGASAAVLVDRGLPNSTNVNDSAGPSRSNVSWQSGIPDGGDYFLAGDDFSLLGPAIINSITVYSVSNAPVGNAGGTPAEEFSSMTLYYGPASLLTLSSSLFTSSAVTYSPIGQNYEGSSGTFYTIYALTFSGLNWSVGAGTYGFALDSVPVGGNTLVMHASNAGLSGTPQQDADDLFRYYTLSGGIATFADFCDTGGACGGWDKSSDINVLVEGEQVPEPDSWVLVAAGVAATAVLTRRRLLLQRYF